MKAAQPAVVPLFDCLDLPLTEIGERGVRLTSLIAHGIPLPAALVIPATSLQLILGEYRLTEKWIKELAQLDWQNAESVARASQSIQKQLAHLQLPHQFANDLLTQYQKWLNDEFVAIRPSFLHGHSALSGWSHLNVRGEVNLWQSVLDIWQRAYEPDQLPDRWQELQRGIATPMAFLLQRMVPADSSGWMTLTSGNTSSVAILEVSSQWGLTPTHQVPPPQLDIFQVDLESHLIRQQQLGTKSTRAESQLDRIVYKQVEPYLQNQASLSSIHLSKLAKLYQTIWYQNIQPPLVEWAIADDDILILDATAAVESAIIKPKELPIPLKNLPISTALPMTYLGKTHVSAPGSLIMAKAHFLAKQLNFTLSDARQPAKQAWWHDRIVQHFQPLLKPFTLMYATELLDSEHPSYRGGLQLLHNPNFFDAEIDALTSLYFTKPANHLGIVVPFVRSISEWGMIERHLRHKTLTNSFTPELWLELAVPANFAELRGYLKYRPDGVVMNWPSLSQLSRGLDWTDTEVAPFYAAEDSLLESVIQPAVKLLQQHTIPVILLVDRASAARLSTLQDWGLSAVIVDPDWQSLRKM